MSNKITAAHQRNESTAKRRWKLLARNLIKSKQLDNFADEGDEVSIRRFKGFDIFKYEKEYSDENGTWYCVKSTDVPFQYNLKIR